MSGSQDSPAPGAGEDGKSRRPRVRKEPNPDCRLPTHDINALHLPKNNGCNLVVNGLFDPLFIHLKLAIIIGLLISSPIWLYQFWAFVAPGLHRRERRWTYFFGGSAIPLFALGGF